jgi:hypothetical protein
MASWKSEGIRSEVIGRGDDRPVGVMGGRMVCGNIGGEEDGEGAMTGMVKLIDADRGLLESLRRQLSLQ